jgi:hypothetical protein
MVQKNVIARIFKHFFSIFKILKKKKVGAKFINPWAKETMFGWILF